MKPEPKGNAIITGASRGIGEAISKCFAAEDYHVILVSRKIDALEKIKTAILETGGSASVIAANMGNLADIRSLVTRVRKNFSGIDVLVNNAATNPYFGPMTEIDEARYDKTWDVNVKGPFFLSNLLIPLMEARPNPNIIHISSVNAFRPPQDQGVYSLTKAAILALVQAQAKELGPKGIRVNGLAPGLIDTKFAQALVEDPERKASFIDHTPSGRLGQPDDIAQAALYLSSSGASYTNGTCLTVDGGYLA